jgi:glycosyltransferase involved in cell wall biosynthesis
MRHLKPVAGTASGPVDGPGCTLSIIIKALNEEESIDAAIRSALAAVEPFSGEVILADSASTDRTVEIAKAYPVTIVQLANPSQRRCGIGPQLGYQFARGRYVYILDGDMQLEPGFLPAAIEALENDPTLGGVAGLVQQQSESNYQFRGLKRRNVEGRSGEAPWLDMGGLYRRSALEEVGYFSNRNLHAFEELELGVRLGAAGWTLRRLDLPAVRHRGYDLDSLALLRRRWRSRYLLGAGEVLKASWGRPWFRKVLFTQRLLLLALGIWTGAIGALLLLPVSPWPLAVVALSVVALVGLRAMRIGSLGDALLGQLIWQVHAIALVRGVLAPTVDPRSPIAARLLQDSRDRASLRAVESR